MVESKRGRHIWQGYTNIIYDNIRLDNDKLEGFESMNRYNFLPTEMLRITETVSSSSAESEVRLNSEAFLLEGRFLDGSALDIVPLEYFPLKETVGGVRKDFCGGTEGGAIERRGRASTISVRGEEPAYS